MVGRTHPTRKHVRTYRTYSFNGLAGCVRQVTSRQIGRLVGIYHAAQAGVESDPEYPWATVCETHGILVLHGTLAMAKWHASYPREWCEECR